MEFNGTFLATIVTFVIFVVLMNKILYAPILGIMEERKNFVDENYKSAEENETKASELTKEKEDKLAEAKEDAKSKYNSALDEFKAQKSEIVEEAQTAAKEDLEKSKIELENISNEAKVALKSSMTDLASDIVEKVIGYRSEIQNFDDTTVDKVLWEK